MPLYEYRCPDCGHQFELIQKFSDPPTIPCTDCGKTANRQLSSPAFQFKGSGWYVTDYARKGQDKGKNEKQDAESSKSESKSDNKAEPSKADSSKADSKNESTKGESSKSESKPAASTTESSPGPSTPAAAPSKT